MSGAAPTQVLAKNKTERMEQGKRVYEGTCLACHQGNGMGVAGAFPPLAKSDFLNADRKRAVQVVVGGLSGPVKVNGTTYNSVMPAQQLSDEDLANALTYVYNSWGNSGGEVTPSEVKAQRSSIRTSSVGAHE